jgi:hypothetical protein
MRLILPIVPSADRRLNAADWQMDHRRTQETLPNAEVVKDGDNGGGGNLDHLLKL